jgi:hypothetical protein
MRAFTAEGYIDLWKEARDGSASYPPHSIYQYITAEFPQMGKSNAALYQSLRVLEEVQGWKLNLDNVVWDVPTFLERRQAMHKWDILIPDEMQRNAGNRTWQTEDNAIVGEEMETGSFEHKHVVMTVPSKHRLDKLIADVCTSQEVVDKTDVHNQISYLRIFSISRGQLDRSADERTPKLGSLTVGKTPPQFWVEYLRRKKEYFDKRRKTNLERAQAIQSEANKPRTGLSADMIESIIVENEGKLRSSSGKFSLSKIRTLLKDEGYGEVPYGRVQYATSNANHHEQAKKELEQVETKG